MNRIFKISSLLVVLVLLATACAAPAPTPAPATKAPASTAVAVAQQSAAAQPTAVPQPTTAAAQPAAAKGKLRIGMWASYVQAIDWNKTIANYNKLNPNVQVEIIPIPDQDALSQQYIQKIQLEAQQKKSTWDLLMVVQPAFDGGLLARLGVLDPLDGLIPQSMLDDMYSGVRKEQVYTGDGKMYFFPHWEDVFGMIYRPSMLKEATGSENPPATWNELLATCDKIKAKYGDKPYCIGLDWTWIERSFLPIFSTMADKVYTSDGLLNLDDPAAKSVLELVQKLYPYMPPSSADNLGGSKAFQAGAVAIELYWQTQMLRAIQAKQPESDIKLVSFPKGTKATTGYYGGGAVIPKYSENKAAALDFILKALLDPETVEMSQVGNWKIVPFKSAQKGLADSGKLPAWSPPLTALLENSEPMPCNPYMSGVYHGVYLEEIQKMILQGQSVDDTLKNIKARAAKGIAEYK